MDFQPKIAAEQHALRLFSQEFLLFNAIFRYVFYLQAILEKMREQVQNIE